MTASDGGLYKLLVIGGGPAGVGVLIRAARTGFLARLLNPSVYGEAQDVEASERVGMKQKGMAIVHDGDASTFGSGNLGKYVINSNTFARSLLSSVLDEKPDLDPPESIKGTFLEHAKDHETTRKLEEIGNAPACLVDFGRFLQNVGICVLNEISNNYAETSKCLLNSRATQFERLESGIYRVEVSENDHTRTLYTEHLVLATGGQQGLPPQLEGNSMYKSKSFLSEDCLRDDGFTRLRDHLLQSNGRKVCIVGGSHSSFSVAWMLLNNGKQPRSKSLTQCPPTTRPVAESLINANESIDTTSNAPNKSDGSRSPTSTVDIDTKSASIDCTATAVKLSSLPSVSKPKSPPLVFQPRDITILHRSPIRCYYFTRKEAEADGADGSRVDRTGCVNTFTGLREDSKHLYKDIKAGKECRVRLFQVNQHGCQNLTSKAYESADAIVWCCGYTTRAVPGFDEEGKPFKFHEDHGVVQLDLQARIQLTLPTKTVVAASNLYGVGLGFSLRSHVDEMGTETRADGATVYHRRGATLVLAAVFGSDVFGKDCKSFEEMVEKNDRNRKKKEPSGSPTESSLAERIKRSAAPTHSASSPLRTPAKAAAGVSSVSSVSAISTQPAVASFVAPMARISPEKPVPRRLSGKPLPSNNTPHSATNPPVKMLLQRRRSAETLHAPGSAARKDKGPQPNGAPRGTAGSLSKAAILQTQANRFGEQDTATPVA